jgi:hypothetical protein
VGELAIQVQAIAADSVWTRATREMIRRRPRPGTGSNRVWSSCPRRSEGLPCCPNGGSSSTPSPGRPASGASLATTNASPGYMRECITLRSPP